MFKITKKLAYKMLDCHAEARFTLKLILKQFKDKPYGKLDRSKLLDPDKQKVKRGMKELKKKDILISITKGYYLLNPNLAIPDEMNSFLKSLWFFKKDYSISYPPVNIENSSNDFLTDIRTLVSNVTGYETHLNYFEFYDYLISTDEDLIEDGIAPKQRNTFFVNSLKSERVEISRLLDEIKEILSEVKDIEKSYETYIKANTHYFDLKDLLHKEFICNRIYDYYDNHEEYSWIMI